MAGPEPLALPTTKPDGTMFARVEMEAKLRESGVHQKRLYAITELNLPSKIAYSMQTITLLHWILDQLIKRKVVHGEIIGVNADPDIDTDPDKFKQFAQRLSMFIENGWAQKPLPGEGIDMSNQMKPPPPPPHIPGPANGQPQAAPAVPAPPAGAPPTPPAPPASPGAYPPPQAAPQQQYAPPAPPAPPGVPQATQPPPAPPGVPQQPSQAPPTPPQQQQQYAPPPPPQAHVPQAAPQAPPAPQQQQQQQSTGEPTKSDPNREWGKPGFKKDGTPKSRRNKKEMAEDEAYFAWVEANGGQEPQQAPSAPAPQAPQPQPGPTPPPNPLAPPPFSAAAPQPQAGGNGDLQMVIENQQAIMAKQGLIDTALAQLLRIQYQQQGPANLESVLTELNLLNP